MTEEMAIVKEAVFKLLMHLEKRRGPEDVRQPYFHAT